jgi:hypothetical protein
MEFSAGLDSRDRDDDIDFVRTVGLNNDDDVFELDFVWRFSKKWSLAGQYFQSSGRAENTLEESLNWNGVEFGAGSNIMGSTQLALVRLFLGRSFGNDPRTNFGIGGGIHWLDLRAAIEGNVLIGDGVQFRREAVSAQAPLPNIGAWYKRSLSERWVVRARVDWLSANVDEYDGRLLNIQAGVDFSINQHVGIGAAYNIFDLDVSVENPKWQGSTNLSFEGMFLFLSAYW